MLHSWNLCYYSIIDISIYRGITYLFDKYLDYSKEEAYTLFCNEKNFKILRRFLYVLIIVFGIVLFVNSIKISFFSFTVILMLISCITSLFLRIYYKRIFNVSNVRKYLFVILIATLLLSLITNVVFFEAKIPRCTK